MTPPSPSFKSRPILSLKEIVPYDQGASDTWANDDSPDDPESPPASTTRTPPPPLSSPAVAESRDCQYDSLDITACSMGYAASARINGGRFRPRYVVTTSFDSTDVSAVPVGSLRWALQYLTDGAYIAFDSSMDVWLQADLFVPSFVTIDAQGAQVRILNGTLVLSGARDVIIHNVEVAGQPRGSLITLYGCKRVWIDHCSLHDAAGAIIEAWHGTTDVTISNNYIRNSLPASRVIQVATFHKRLLTRLCRVLCYRYFSTPLSLPVMYAQAVMTVSPQGRHYFNYY
ncbi:unnamed protein product [Closterium sp. NIES-64]|nr:unnamed protein product [Closterium sp. NIES-64]